MPASCILFMSRDCRTPGVIPSLAKSGSSLSITIFRVWRPRIVARSRAASPAPCVANGTARSAATRNIFAFIPEWYSRESRAFRFKNTQFAVLAYGVPRKIPPVHGDIHSRRQRLGESQGGSQVEHPVRTAELSKAPWRRSGRWFCRRFPRPARRRSAPWCRAVRDDDAALGCFAAAFEDQAPVASVICRLSIIISVSTPPRAANGRAEAYRARASL